MAIQASHSPIRLPREHFQYRASATITASTAGIATIT